MNKITVALLFGGKSAEHEISLISASNVMEAMDKEKYNIVLIGIDKQGQWHINEDSNFILEANNPKLVKLNHTKENIAVVPGADNTQIAGISNVKNLPKIDVVFPILHGPLGEDGTVQGMLKLMNLPFVGPDVLGSAVGMDKDVMKRLLIQAGIPTCDYLSYRSYEADTISFEVVKEKLGLPLFIKPANMGSSIGVSKARDEQEFKKAVKSAFEYDNKIIIEAFVEGREIECAILGNEDPQASIPGEITASHDFYSYEAKYVDEKGAKLQIPANLTDEEINTMQALAIKTFKTLCCEGLSRVDMFYTKEGKFMVNEINTIPGFTKVSMYPQMWEASGLPYSKLIDELINLAIKRYKRDSKLKSKVE